MASSKLVEAETPTPTTNSKISDLKERIASRVAELNLVERRGMLGTIASISGTRINLVDLENRTRLVEVDELTQSDKIKDKTKLLSGFSSGNSISVLGLYNKSSRILLARFINDAQIFSRIFGEVTAIDKKNFLVSVKANEKEVVVEIESSTQTSSLTDSILVRGGFSKIEIGEKVFAVLVPQESTATNAHYSALRFIMFPQLSPTKTPTPSATSTPSPAKKTP